MKNLINTIECKIHHCLYIYRSFSNKKTKGTCHLVYADVKWRNIVLLFLIVPIFPIVAQTQKAAKSYLQEGKIYFTPLLKGSSPMIKQRVIENPNTIAEKKSPADLDMRSFKRSSSSLTKQQLTAKINSSKKMSNEVPVYTGTADQRSPKVVSDISGLYVVFENYDILGGSYPYGSVDIYKSIDGGQVWIYWNSVSSSSYHLYSPQIVIVGSDIVVSYQRNGALRTFRFDPADEKLNPDVPMPVVSTSEYVVDFTMVTDAQKYIGTSYLYIAFLFKQADGKNKVLFCLSADTARTWKPYDSIGLSQPELNSSSIGLDFSSSGLYLAYLGTDANSGSIVLRKSTSFGSSWTSEITLPMNVFGGLNKKIGPMVSAMGQRVAVVYQYDYKGDATDWKTGSDFDVYAVVSDDGGASWQERVVSWWSGVNEILPSVTSDYDGNFYVSFIQGGKARVSMAGSEFSFGYSDSSSTAKTSLDDFPSIYGSAIASTNTAYTAWTELSDSNGLNIYGASISLKIPPLSPSNLTANAVSNSDIKLSWTDNSLDESEFIIYYRQSGSGAGFTQIASVSTNVISYTVTGLSPIGYDFYVRAYSANGLSLRTNIASATPGGNTGPAAPQNLTATPGNSKITLKWNKNTESDFLRYRIYGGISANPTTRIDSTTGGSTDTTKAIPGLSNGTTYYFRITAVNNAGLESGVSNEVNATPVAAVDNTPPTISMNAPAGVPVVVSANGQVSSSPQVSASANDGVS